MRINNNSNSTIAQSALSLANSSHSKSLQRLATGLRINSAADDAAGLSASESLSSMVRANQKSQSNANDGMAMMQIADTGSQQITDSLQRMKELAIQSANGTLKDSDRTAIQAEYKQLQDQITGIAQSTTYNGQSLLSGGASSGVSFQVSDGSGAASNISFQASADLSGNLGLGTVDSAGSAQNAMDGIDKALKSVLSMRSGIGATMNSLGSAASNLGNVLPNLTDAQSRIRDTDFAAETMKLAKAQILGQSSMAMLSQANQIPSGVMSLLR